MRFQLVVELVVEDGYIQVIDTKAVSQYSESYNVMGTFPDIESAEAYRDETEKRYASEGVEPMRKSIAEAYLAVSLRIPVDDIKVKQRLDRGYDIAQSDGLGYEVVPVGNGNYRVEKASTTLLEDNSHGYDVTRESCTCPDFETARGNLCKHRLAVMLIEEMEL